VEEIFNNQANKEEQDLFQMGQTHGVNSS